MKKILLSLAILPALMLLTCRDLQAQFTEKPAVMPRTGVYFHETAGAGRTAGRGLNPVISACVAEVNVDSIRATIQHLQDYVSRFMLLDNRKTIAEWIMSRFIAYGYTDARLDSFYLVINIGGGQLDSVWQYNVVCTVTGNSAPGEVYVTGGHYDAITNEDPYNIAYGADDNGSAVAATLEMARVMKKMNYQPEATLRFTLFAAEELGLFGSQYAALKAWQDHENIRLMVNLDMIANNPDSTNDVVIYRYPYSEWAADVTADATERYTSLQVFFVNTIASSSDSYPYYLAGFPVSYFEEFDFSPNWHRFSDTIGNCNIMYCADITRGALATLMEQQFLPYPELTAAVSTKDDITLSWFRTQNSNVTGYNIYRSVNPDSLFEKMATVTSTDSSWVDQDVERSQLFYYFISSLNQLQEESFPSRIVHGARFGFGDTLLVVACLPGTKVSPDSIIQFYSSALDSIPFRWYDHNTIHPLDLSALSRYRNVLFLLNTLDYEVITDDLAGDIITFFNNGGNMLVSGFTPTRFFIHTSVYPMKIPEETYLYKYFRIDSVDLIPASLLYRANPLVQDWDTLHIDPLKIMTPSYPGEVYDVEFYAPAPGAAAIYRFDSRHPSTTTLGAAQGKTVGLEYLGDDHKVVWLSFPLYYADTADAREFLHYVIGKKFRESTGVPVYYGSGNSLDQNYPNPFSGETTLSFTLRESSMTDLSVYDLPGRKFMTLCSGKMDKGRYEVPFSSGNLPPGIYIVVLKTGNTACYRKMVIAR